MSSLQLFFNSDISSNGLHRGEGEISPTYDAGTECYLSAFQWCHWEIPDSSQSECAVEGRYLKEGKLSCRCIVMENIQASVKSDSFLNFVSFLIRLLVHFNLLALPSFTFYPTFTIERVWKHSVFPFLLHTASSLCTYLHMSSQHDVDRIAIPPISPDA